MSGALARMAKAADVSCYKDPFAMCGSRALGYRLQCKTFSESRSTTSAARQRNFFSHPPFR